MSTTQIQNTVNVEELATNMVNQDAEGFTKYGEMILESMHFADRYTKARSYKKTGITESGTTAIGLARLNWLLEEGRLDLNGYFNPSEFAILCSSVQDEICELSSIMKLVDVVANYLGLDFYTYPESPYADLMNRLMSLSALQSLALRDLLEEYWHLRMHKMTCAEFLKKKGLN